MHVFDLSQEDFERKRDNFAKTNVMNRFALLFRMNLTDPNRQPSPTEMKRYMADWNAWISGMDAADQLADGGDHFAPAGRVLSSGNTVEDGPYKADDLSVAGFILVWAADLDHATEIAAQCPILAGAHTSVEIRETALPGA